MDTPAPSPTAAALPRRNALRFIFLLGIVSLFADTTYEGARSNHRSVSGVLGASATVVGLVSGFGELTGYALRLASGYVSDRTGRYLPGRIGLSPQTPAVPPRRDGAWVAGGSHGRQPGQTVRAPARAKLSLPVVRSGGVGLRPARGDGPSGSDRRSADPERRSRLRLRLPRGLRYSCRARSPFDIGAVGGAVSVPSAARPRPGSGALEAKGLPPVFWVYMLAIAFIAAGYADYALIAFHFDKSGVVPTVWIPLLYATPWQPTPSPRWRSDGRSTGSACGPWPPRPRLRRLGALAFLETSGWRVGKASGDSAWAPRNR